MFDGISFLPIRLRIDPNENLEEQIKQYDRLIDSIVFKIKQFMFEQSLIEPIEQYEILGYEEALTKEQYEQINKTPLN
jgi:hypothetical protein